MPVYARTHSIDMAMLFNDADVAKFREELAKFHEELDKFCMKASVVDSLLVSVPDYSEEAGEYSEEVEEAALAFPSIAAEAAEAAAIEAAKAADAAEAAEAADIDAAEAEFIEGVKAAEAAAIEASETTCANMEPHEWRLCPYAHNPSHTDCSAGGGAAAAGGGAVTSRPVCWFFKHGGCTFGKNCRNLHPSK